MRKILRFLATSTLVVPIVTSTVACNGKLPDPNPDPQIDFDGTLTLIKNNISKNLIKTINKANLINETDFKPGEWDEIKSSLKKNIKDDAEIKNISKLTDKLAEKMNQIITESINDIWKNTFLAIFFNNVQKNEILQLDTEDTKYIKEKFDWHQLASQIPEKAKIDFNNITFWDKVTSKVVIKMNYFDNNGKKQQYKINESYFFELYNQSEKVPEMINIVSANFSNKLKDYNPQINLGAQRIDYQTELSQYNNLLEKNVIARLKDKDLIISEGKAGDISTDEGWSNSGLFGRNISGLLSYNTYRYLKMDKANFKKEFTVFSQTQEKVYETKLNKWITKNNVKTSDNQNIMLFGQYAITNWSYKGLILNPLSLNYTVSQNDTRQQQIQTSAEFLSSLFATNGLLKNKIEDENDGHNYTMLLSKTNFEALKKQDETVDHAIKYEQQEITKVAKDNNKLKDSDKFIFNTHYFGGSSDSNIHNLKINEHLENSTTFHYHKDSYTIFMVCSFNNIFVNFSRTNAAGCINDFYIKESNN